MAVDDQPRAEAEDGEPERRDDSVHRQPKEPAEELQPDLVAEQPIGCLPEARGFAPFEPERLDDGLRGVVLAGDGEHVSGLFLHGDAALLRALGHGLVDEAHQRRAEQDDASEQWVEDHEDDCRHDQREDLERALSQRLRQSVLEHHHVGEETGGDVALLAVREPPGRELLQTHEHPGAQLPDHGATDVRREVGAAQTGE